MRKECRLVVLVVLLIHVLVATGHAFTRGEKAGICALNADVDLARKSTRKEGERLRKFIMCFPSMCSSSITSKMGCWPMMVGIVIFISYHAFSLACTLHSRRCQKI